VVGGPSVSEEFLNPEQSEFFLRGYPSRLLRGPKAAHKHLAALEEKGFIRRRSGLSRAVEVVGWSGKGAGSALPTPVVGRVRAGMPILASEEVEGHLRLDPFIAPAGSFVLRVVGDSMIEAGIRDGDYAVIRPDARPRNGAIVVALLDDEATVKRFYRVADQIRLEPAHSGMEPIIVKPGEKEVRIIGCVIAIIRKY